MAEATGDRGSLATLIQVWFEPRRAFEGIVRSPRFWAPLLAHLVVVAAFSAIWVQKVDPGEFMKNQLVESGQWDKMPPEARANVTGGSGGFFRAMVGVGAFVGGLGFPLLTAGTLFFVFRFFYASEVDFRQALAISAWIFLAVSVVSTPLMLLVVYLKDEWNWPAPELLQAGPALLVERGSISRPLWTLLQGFDLLSLWTVVLLALGFGVASQRTLGRALWGVGAPWVLIVLLRVALAAL